MSGGRIKVFVEVPDGNDAQQILSDGIPLDMNEAGQLRPTESKQHEVFELPTRKRKPFNQLDRGR